MTADKRLVHALEELVVGAVGLTTAALEAFAPSADLTLQQWRALVVVARADGLRIGELGRRVGSTTPSTSRLVRRLERRGLVRTERDETDRRATVVRATDRGLSLWSNLVAHRRALIAELLDGAGLRHSTATVSNIEELAEAFARYS